MSRIKFIPGELYTADNASLLIYPTEAKLRASLVYSSRRASYEPSLDKRIWIDKGEKFIFIKDMRCHGRHCCQFLFASQTGWICFEEYLYSFILPIRVLTTEG